MFIDDIDDSDLPLSKEKEKNRNSAEGVNADRTMDTDASKLPTNPSFLHPNSVVRGLTKSPIKYQMKHWLLYIQVVTIEDVPISVRKRENRILKQGDNIDETL